MRGFHCPWFSTVKPVDRSLAIVGFKKSPSLLPLHALYHRLQLEQSHRIFDCTKEILVLLSCCVYRLKYSVHDFIMSIGDGLFPLRQVSIYSAIW